MPKLESSTADVRRSTAASELSARERRKQRVMSLLAEGLPTPSGRVFELVQLLGEPVLDLDGVSEVIRSEPLLNAQISGLLNVSPFEEFRQARDFSETVVLLGSERLRIVALGCALAEFAGRRLPQQVMRDFWHHSILTGLLAEKIARQARPEGVERAYLGGLLHNIGRLPLLIVAREQEPDGNEPPRQAQEELAAERSYFGVDHCEVGRWIALSGNFARWMQCVIVHHHDAWRAPEEQMLVAIVAAADRCAQTVGRKDLPRMSAPPDRTACSQGPLNDRRLRRLLEEHRSGQSPFLGNSALQTVGPRFGVC